MSSLSELSKDITDTEELLLGKVNIFLDLEVKADEASAEVNVIKKHLARLQRAHAILTGSEPEPIGTVPAILVSPPVPVTPTPAPPHPSVTPTVPKVPAWMRCSCGDTMYETVRKMGSGAVVRLLQCPGCNNERYI